jgi:hypothetical protein
MIAPGFIGPAYTSISRAINAQRCINLRLEIDSANGKSPLSLVGLPGYSEVKTDFPASEVRGFWLAQGRVFVVVGSTLYELNSDLTHTVRGTLATASGRVSFADNGLQMLIVDGVGVLGLTFSTNSTVTTIANFPYGATHIACVDNTMIAAQPNSQIFQISAVGNAYSWAAIDFASAEGLPDDIVAIIPFSRQVYMLGSGSVQIFWNSGDANRPFIPVEGSSFELGCVAPYSVAKDESGVYWLGGDPRGGPRVYKGAGGQFTPISTPGMDAAFIGSNGEPAYTVSDAFGYTFRMDGHVYYVLTFPTSDKTWIYDAVSEGWSEFLEWDTQWRRHRSNCAIYAFGRQLIGDFENGKLYELSPNVYANGSAVQRALRASAYVHNSQELLTIGSFEVVCEPGVGLTSGQGSDPQMMLRVSKDGANTWTGEMMRPIGVKGEFRDRARFLRPVGNSRSFVFEVSITDPVKRVLTAGVINGN